MAATIANGWQGRAATEGADAHRAAGLSAALADARRGLIVQRLPLFATGWLCLSLAWSLLLVVESRLTPFAAGLALVTELAILVGALALCRTASSTAYVEAVAVSACVLLNLTSTVQFAAIGGDAGMLAFLVFVVCLASTMMFAWRWRAAVTLYACTLVAWLLAVPSLRFFVPPLEIATHFAIGSVVWVVIAIGSARSFRDQFLSRAAEREAVRELAASRDAYRDLAEEARDFIWTSDLNGVFTYVNDALARHVGEPASAIIGRPVREFMTDNPTNPDIAALMARRRRDEAIPPQVFECRTIHGPRWVETVGTSIYGPAGEVVGVRGVGRDVTERHLAQTELGISLMKLQSSEGRLRTLARRLVAVREEERKRLGIDLHDNVCQELVGLGILVESVRQRVGATCARSNTQLMQVVEHLSHVVEHLRQTARELRPLQLQDLGLEGSLRSLIDGASSAGIRVSLTCASAIPRLDEDTEVALYRIAQEALTNAVRHAAARTIRVALAADGGALVLEVTDDGRGFDPAQPREVFGLANMEERALAIGGRFELHSKPGKGTMVRLECGLPESRLAAGIPRVHASRSRRGG